MRDKIAKLYTLYVEDCGEKPDCEATHTCNECGEMFADEIQSLFEAENAALRRVVEAAQEAIDSAKEIRKGEVKSRFIQFAMKVGDLEAVLAEIKKGEG